MRFYENVETARSYDFWCGVWLISNVVGRTLRVERPQAPVYLNVYAILCAEAGITRKTSAVRYATDMLKHYIDTYESSKAVLSGGITTDALDHALAKQSTDHGSSHIALSSTELVSLLGRDRYSAGLPGRLTDLYDCPTAYTRTTLARGETVIRDAYVTLLGASTPSWLIRAVNPDVIEGGFTSRCLFVIEEEPKRLIAWPEESDNADRFRLFGETLYRVRQECEYVAKRRCGILLTRVARQQFVDWYEKRTPGSSHFGSSFGAREDHHVLRLAGILAISDNRWEVDEHHVANAINVITHIKQTSSVLFGSGMASSRTFSLVDKIRGALVAAGRSGISQSALSALCRKHGSLSDQRTVLTVMHEMGLIQVFKVESGEAGRPITMYRATRTLAHARAVEEVVDMIVPPEEV